MLPLVHNFDFDTVLLDEETVSLLDDFSCGHYEIDRYVKEDALLNRKLGKGVTYLVLDTANNDLVGYYTLSSTAVLYFDDKDISEKSNIDDVPIRGIPSIELKMFGVSVRYQDRMCLNRVGRETLISDVVIGSVIGVIYDIAMHTSGAEMIVLQSVPDAVNFYERNSFLSLDEYRSLDDHFTKGCVPMYLRLFE